MKPRLTRILAAAALCLSFHAAPAHPAVVTPSERIDVTWTIDEQKQEMAKRPLYEDGYSKHFLIRLSRSEKPHSHAEPLTAWLRKGKAIIHMRDEAYYLEEGDVAVIPKDVLHWAEIEEGQVCEVYAIFHKAPAPEQES